MTTRTKTHILDGVIDNARSVRVRDLYGHEIEAKPKIYVPREYKEYAGRIASAGVLPAGALATEGKNERSNMSRRGFLKLAGAAAVAAAAMPGNARADSFQLEINDPKYYVYRDTASSSSVYSGVQVPDVILIERYVEPGTSVDLLDLYKAMTGTGNEGFTKTWNWLSYPVKVWLNENDPAVAAAKRNGQGDFVAAFRAAMDAWARWPPYMKVFEEVPAEPDIGVRTVYRNAGGVLSVGPNEYMTDSNGNTAYKKWQLFADPLGFVGVNYPKIAQHEFGHLIGLTREDTNTGHIMYNGGVGQNIQPIEYKERDCQVMLPNGHDMKKYSRV